jgi:hypothetical protein
MIFLWILTWFSYWIFMKQQINSINLVGAGISACLLVFSHFFPTRGGSSKGPKQFKQALPENSKEHPLKLLSLDLPSDIQEQRPYETTEPSLLQLSDQHKTEESHQQPPFELQPQEVEVFELAKEPEPAEIDTPQMLPKKRNRRRKKHKSLDSPSVIQEQIFTESLTIMTQSGCNTIEEATQHLPVIELQPQEVDVVELAKEPEPAEIDKCQQTPEKSNGCPKDLDYFTQKPRPKQTPEECFTCKNLIACVCNTDN